MKTLDFKAISKTIADLRATDLKLLKRTKAKALTYDDRIEIYKTFDKAFKTIGTDVWDLLQKLSREVATFEEVKSHGFNIPTDNWQGWIAVNNTIQAVQRCRLKDGACLVDNGLENFESNVRRAYWVSWALKPNFYLTYNLTGSLNEQEMDELLKKGALLKAMRATSECIEELLEAAMYLSTNILDFRNRLGKPITSPEV